MRKYSKLFGLGKARAVDQTAKPEEIIEQLESARQRVSNNTYRSYVYSLEKIGLAADKLQLASLPQLTDAEIKMISTLAIQGLKPASARGILNVASIFINKRFLWMATKKGLKSNQICPEIAFYKGTGTS